MGPAGPTGLATLPDVRRIVAVVILLALILSLLASVVTALG